VQTELSVQPCKPRTVSARCRPNIGIHLPRFLANKRPRVRTQFALASIPPSLSHDCSPVEFFPSASQSRCPNRSPCGGTPTVASGCTTTLGERRRHNLRRRHNDSRSASQTPRNIGLTLAMVVGRSCWLAGCAALAIFHYPHDSGSVDG
jgi:hypothetical protein